MEDIEGDLLERFEKVATIKSLTSAKWMLFFEVVRLFRPNMIRSFFPVNTMSLFKNFNHYSRVSFRLFKLNKLVTVFSLVSLIVGGCSSFLMYKWVQNELTMDDFHQKKNSLHFMMIKPEPVAESRFMPTFLATDLREKYPEIIDDIELQFYNMDDEAQLSNDDRALSIDLMVSDPHFFNVFDFPLLYGNTHDALKDPLNIVISESLAKTYFGEEYPIGKNLTLFCGEKATYTVAGVLEDLPPNSSIQFDALVNNVTGDDNRWSRSGARLILVSKDFNAEKFNDKIAEEGRSHPQFQNSELFTVPYSSIYFGSTVYGNLFSRYGDEKVVNNMILISIIVFVICLFGFTNLQHIQQLSVNKSLAVRCINGANRLDLFHEVLVGRFYLMVISVGISMLLLIPVIPAFASMVQLPISNEVGPTAFVLIGIVGMIIGCSLLFSAFHIYKFKLVDAFRKTFFMGSIPFLQRSVTVLQYTITITLIVASLIAFLQYDHMINKDLGIDYENIIEIKLANEMLMDQSKSRDQLWKEYEQLQKDYQWVLGELEGHSSIVESSQSSKPVDGSAYSMEVRPKQPGLEYETIRTLSIDPNYKNLLGLNVTQGRFFEKGRDESRGPQVVINEAARKLWGIDDIEGVTIDNKYWGEFDLIGVVEDFNYESLTSSIEPLALFYMTDIESPFLIKIQEGQETDAIEFLEQQHALLSPGRWFGYSYLSDEIEAQYSEERMIFRIYWAFTMVAVLLSFMNLFAFAWSESRRRIKEMGIRKVHGANPVQLFLKLGFSFWKLVFIAFVLANPVAWYLMTNWLADYSYRIEMEWWYYLVGGLAAFAISLVAISGQSWKVVKTNPVDVLRYE